MLIAGAGGHAIELLGLLDENQYQQPIFFYDDTAPASGQLFNQFPVLHTPAAAAELFKQDRAFALGVGKPALRKALAEKLIALGGSLQSLISNHARIGRFEVELAAGLNIMAGAIITQRIQIGRGTLIHHHCSIHHDVVIGEFCEISPGSRLLGGVQIGDQVSIGAGAILLPRVRIGNNAVIGAGAVVTRNVADGSLVKGIPAKPGKQ